MSLVEVSTMNRSIFLLVLSLSALDVVAQVNDIATSRGAWNLPVTIEVKQDVQVRSSERRADGLYGQERGTLYTGADFSIRKGQRFKMINIGQEGGCRIKFQEGQFELSSCPWLAGFTDHQEDIFMVLQDENNFDEL